MNILRKILAACMFVSLACSVSSVLAADAATQPSSLPDLGESVQQQGHATAAEYMQRDGVCLKCHDENDNKPTLSIFATKHGVKGDPSTPTCQACHGASDAHVKNVDGKSTRPAPDIRFGTKKDPGSSYPVSEAKVQNTACLSCHDKDARRTHWEGGPHSVNDVACTSCHTLHTKHDNVRDKKTQPQVCFACHKEQRVDIRKVSHHAIGEGKVVCSDCHNPHGSGGPKLLKKNTVNETCHTCHAEKRGPYLWEHQPVTEDCTNCHTPHGSNITPLLKSRPPFLCDECHNGPHQSKNAVGRNAAGTQGGLNVPPSENYTGRACMNCHSMVHGSNHPSGALLQR